MELFLGALQYLFVLVLTVVIKYRLPHRILGLRYPAIPTFLIMLVIHVVAGEMNVRFHLTGDIPDNTLYYSVMTLLLYQVLFRGSFVKKVFLTVLLGCGFPTIFYLFLPFAHFFFRINTPEFMLALNFIEAVNTLATFVGMEYIGKRFQNLRRELPTGYTVYLTAVILFVYVAVFSAYDRMFMTNRGEVSLFAALGIVIFVVSGIIIVAIAIFAMDHQVTVLLREQLHLLQTENLKTRELEWRRFSGFRHDIKNHLICLSGLLEGGKTERAAAYMRNLTDTMKQFDNPVETGNDYADALLSVKYAEAVAAKITISVDMAIPSEGFAEPVDLCCILSNAFDNAIAACCRLEEGERWITARGFIKQGQLILTVKNSKPSYATVINGEAFPKEIAADHGLGLDTVKAVVEKYGGVMHLSAEDAFTFSVLLPQLRS